MPKDTNSPKKCNSCIMNISYNSYIYNPKKTHNYTVIYLHGFTGTGSDYSNKFISKKLIQDECKIIFPTAPLMNISLYNKQYHSWYDYLSHPDGDAESKANLTCLEKSYHEIEKIIKSEYKILKDHKRIYIGGVSQGVSSSFYVLMKYKYNLGGYFGIMGNILLDSFNKKKINTDMIFYNSVSDKVVQWKWAKKNIQILQKTYNNVKLITEDNVKHSSYRKEKEWFNKAVFDLITNR